MVIDNGMEEKAYEVNNVRKDPSTIVGRNVDMLSFF